MAFTKRFVKHPDEIIDYDFDFTSWLSARADTLESYNVAVDDGIFVASSSVVNGTIVRVYVSGGTAGHAYIVAAEILTDGGRTKRAQIQIRVQGLGPIIVPGTEGFIDLGNVGDLVLDDGVLSLLL